MTHQLLSEAVHAYYGNMTEIHTLKAKTNESRTTFPVNKRLLTNKSQSVSMESMAHQF